MAAIAVSTYTYLWRTDIKAALADVARAGFSDVELLAAPLLRLWREAEDDRHLRQEVSTALGGLYAMISTLDDASYDAAIDHALTGDGTARET